MTGKIMRCFLYSFIGLFFFASCQKTEETGQASISQKDTTKVPACCDEAIMIDTSEVGVQDFSGEYQLNFVVSVAEGRNFDSLHGVAQQAAQLLKFKFDMMGRVFDQKRGIILPDDAEDDIWAGQYLFRREGEEAVSIEKTFAYEDTTFQRTIKDDGSYAPDTNKMFVFATMYPERYKADSLKLILLKTFPSTKVIPVDIYMGCMH